MNTLNNIEAVFEGEVKSFSGSSNYASLVDSLKKSYGEFGSFYVIKSSGAFIPVSSDTDLEAAKTNAGSVLRVFLVPVSGDGSRYLQRKFLVKWMKKHACESIPFAQPVVAILVKEGFKPKDIKKNFNVVLENAGDADLTLAFFHSLCQVKNKRLKRRYSHDEEPRKKRRCSRGEKNLEKAKVSDSSDLMAVDTPSSKKKKAKARSGDGQTHELSKEFSAIAVNAYPEDAGQKLLTKQFAKVILDGNNMLFITSELRGLTVGRKRAKAEKLLSVAALAFSQIVGITIEVVFDQTRLPKAMNSDQNFISQPEISLANSSLQEFNAKISQIAVNFPVIGIPLAFPNGTFVSVSSARPEFASTDDKLISWARANFQQPTAATTTSTSTTTSTAIASTTTTTTTTTLPLSSPNSSSSGSSASSSLMTIPNSSILVVTSDRALAGELCSLGVPLMKPGTWISRFVSLFASGEKTSKDSAKEWFDNWVKSVVSDKE
jgi:hypothetical protein